MNNSIFFLCYSLSGCTKEQSKTKVCPQLANERYSMSRTFLWRTLCYAAPGSFIRLTVCECESY